MFVDTGRQGAFFLRHISRHIKFTAFVFFFISAPSLFAQNHVSVPLNDPVYYVLEQAQLRGLCAPLSTVKPYSRAVVLRAIDAILSSDQSRRFGRLSDAERNILQNERAKYVNETKSGFDWLRGAYHFRSDMEESVRFEGDAGFSSQMMFSNGFSKDNYEWGTNDLLTFYMKGDMGKHLSFDFSFSAAMMRAMRYKKGEYNTYYSGFRVQEDPLDQNPKYLDSNNRNNLIDTYDQPYAYFPYTFQKHWDGFIFTVDSFADGASGMRSWPNTLAFGLSVISELTGELLNSTLRYRFGRLRREWGAMSNGRSIIFNSAAQPFIALEVTYNPLSWFAFSSLTGVLEYYNSFGIKRSAATNQNAYSIEQLEKRRRLMEL